MENSPTTAFRQFKDEELLSVAGEDDAGREFAVPRARAILYCLINALLTGCLYGYSTGIIAGTGQSVVHDFYEDKSASSDSYTWLWSFVTADILFGGMLGSIVGPPIADKIGRKWALVVTGAICAVFSLCLSFAAKEDGGDAFYALAIISRTCLGVSVGMSCTVGPTYTNEMAPAGMAGKLGTMFQLFLCSAITFAYAVNYVFNSQNATYVALTNWRIEFGLGAIFGILLALAGAFVLPETPVYRASKRAAAAAETEYTREGPGVGDAEGIDTSRAEWLRFFCPKAAKDLKFFVLATMLAVSQQLTGINAVMFYAPVIFKAAGMQVRATRERERGRDRATEGRGRDGGACVLFSPPPSLPPSLIYPSIAFVSSHPHHAPRFRRYSHRLLSPPEHRARHLSRRRPLEHRLRLPGHNLGRQAWAAAAHGDRPRHHGRRALDHGGRDPVFVRERKLFQRAHERHGNCPPLPSGGQRPPRRRCVVERTPLFSCSFRFVAHAVSAHVLFAPLSTFILFSFFFFLVYLQA